MTLFQVAKNTRPAVKALPLSGDDSCVKWVPVNKSFMTLVKIILRAAKEHLAVANLSITLRSIEHQGYRHLVLGYGENNQYMNIFDALEEFIISSEIPLNLHSESLSSVDTITVPINYEQHRLGYLVADLLAPKDDSRELPTLDAMDDKHRLANLNLVVSDIVSIVRRYETRYRAIAIYGDQFYWIGNSRALRQLEQRIDQLAPALHPILIRGNKGTGKLIAARTLHSLRHTNTLSFVESSCNEWRDGAAASILPALYSHAKGGTLLLRNVDKLSDANFLVLEQFWSARCSDLADLGAEAAVGVIFTVSQYAYKVTSELASWLKMSCIVLELPNLSERREDVSDLVRFFMAEFVSSIDFDFTEEAWHFLESFTWQGNVAQLKNVVQKAALMADEGLVSVDAVKSLLAE